MRRVHRHESYVPGTKLHGSWSMMTRCMQDTISSETTRHGSFGKAGSVYFVRLLPHDLMISLSHKAGSRTSGRSRRGYIRGILSNHHP